MGLYALGKVAATAAIIAAVNARITTLADGSLSLDVASLQQWITDQGSLIVEDDVAPENEEAAKGVLAVINAEPAGRRLANHIGKGNWMSRADWPTSGSITSSQGFVSAVATAIQDTGRAVESIEAIYADQSNGIEDVLDRAASELALDAKLPATRERIFEDRFYVYTYVDDWDQESAPSPISAMVRCSQDDMVDITIDAAPSGRNIDRWRFYRSNLGLSSAEFQFLAEGAIGVLSGTDNKASSELGEVCPTTTWLEPPAGLRGLVNMKNGFWAGFFDNTVAFSEAFVNYAWPVAYQKTTAMPIVAIGSLGDVLVVSHQGGIDYMTGADPSSVESRTNISVQACVAARSMVQVEVGSGAGTKIAGLVYASADGLCLATGSGVQLITENIFFREDWQAIVPASIIGGYHEGTYYMMWNSGAASGCYALNLDTLKLTTLELAGSTFYTDALTDRLYTGQGFNVVAVFGGTGRRTGRWRSKIAVMPKPSGFAWLTVESDFSAPITVNWYADGALRHTVPLTSRTPVRLPLGDYLEHEVEIITTARWNSLTMASSTAELKQI